MRFLFQKLWVLLPVLMLSGCGAQAVAESVSNEVPTRRDYIRQFYSTGAMTFVYGSQGADGGAACKRYLEELKSQARRTTITVKSDTETTREELGQSAVFLVGTPETNSHIAEAIAKLPVAIDSQNIQFDGKPYVDPSDVFMLSFYPNPWNKQFPLGLITSANEEAITEFFRAYYAGQWRRFFRDRWGYELFRKGHRMIMGHFSEKPENLWALDKETHWDLSAGVKELAAGNEHRYISHGIDTEVEAWLSMEARHQQVKIEIERFFGKQNGAEVSYHLYPSSEIKGLKTRNTDHAHFNVNTAEVHLIHGEEYEGNDAAQVAMMWLNKIGGKASLSAWETGLAIHFTPRWQKEGYEYWAAKLCRAKVLPEPEALFDSETFQGLSPIVRGVASALWVEFMLEEEGKEGLIKRYQTAETSEATPIAHKRQFRKYLNTKFAELPDESGRVKRPLPYIKGFNFAHEGYQIYNGYASSKATEAIAALQGIGANSLSVIPYSYLRDPKKPSRFPFAHSAGDENDEGLIHCAFEAHKRGMMTIMKPQIWVGRGSWPGDIEMKSNADWEAFARNYEAWIVHYALLAEIHGMDMLCIGTEFAKATLAREQDWRKLIRKLRHLYSGPMVYAANWGEEFENVKFWDELDYMGLDCYYPITKNNKPSDAELLKGFESIMDKVEKYARKYDKPVLLTEIGYRSIEAPWKQPHESDRGPDLSMECQERCYQAVVTALEDEEWIAGILWWKWPSTLENGGPGHQGFTPNGKPAEKVIEAWFREME